MPHKLLQKLQFIQELEGFYSVQKSEQEMEIAVRKEELVHCMTCS